jgi:hypothetical protein
MLSAAARFFRRVLQASHACTPRVIIVDRYAAYPQNHVINQLFGIAA